MRESGYTPHPQPTWTAAAPQAAEEQPPAQEPRDQVEVLSGWARERLSGLTDKISEQAAAIKKTMAHGSIDARIEQQFEKFAIPKFEETGITDQSTSEDMNSRQFKEFKKVEKFAHRVIKAGKGGAGKPPDLSKFKSDREKLEAIMQYEVQRTVQAQYGKAIKGGVLGSLNAGATAGERYEQAKGLAEALEVSKSASKQAARGLYDQFDRDPQAFLRTYEEKYRKKR
ncbi:MAG: hypothetical protein FJX76_13445 [Armatimonadetes bacterium]|nr:hypothetical protein [Armatimonadota bacterium]